MSFTEILDAVKAMPRGEQVSLMQTLKEEVGELTTEETILGRDFQSGKSFDVWFPHTNSEAVAAALLAIQLGEHGGA